MIKRREFIAGLGSAAACPIATRAQQGDRVRRIGVLLNRESDDPESLRRMAAFAQGLQELGWTDGRSRGRATGARQSRREAGPNC
jgi:putative ABC transport system substrate-binding protein